MNHGHPVPLLELRHVSVTEGLSGRPLVQDVSFSLQRGHCLGIVGESGSGKSLLCRALLGLLPSGLVRSGQLHFDGRDLGRLDPAGWRELRGTGMAVILQQAMTAFFKERLSTYLIENKDAANKIMEQVLINKRSRENAEKTRQSIKTNLQQKTDMANRVQKFIDCRSKDKNRREIYIVEGDSAAGAIRTSRDAEFQGVMPVRGKILNCLKEDYPRIFKSDIIMDLMRVLGCGVEIKDKRIKNLGAFDLDNLNWNKVIICTDADVDGYHIRTLVLTMLYRLVPTLIDEGYVYIAESPLYEINCKEKTYFAYTELEKNGILKEIGDQKCSINRSKGLGENDPDMMWLTTMNPETRRLIKVEPEDVTKMETMFNLLLGNDEAGRKRHISEHGKEYLDQLDLQ